VLLSGKQTKAGDVYSYGLLSERPSCSVLMLYGSVMFLLALACVWGGCW
jgi:hypothetical protein